MLHDRKLAVIMFTDIVGYSSLMESDEGTALYLLEMNRQIIKSSLKNHKGTWIKEIGDGSLSTFRSTIDALNCTSEILKLIDEFPNLKLRIALHLGDIIQENNDIFGDGVNVTSRLEPLAPTNGIAITEHFYNQIKDKTSHNFQSIGFPILKNIKAKIEVFTWDPLDKNHGSPNITNQGINKESKVLSWVGINKKIIIVSLLLCLGSYFIWQQSIILPKKSQELATTSDHIDENSIAVLKFHHIGKQIHNQYFNEGLSEELLNILSRIKELKVASRTSSWSLPDNVTSDMVRERLKVNYLVEGSVRRSEDKIRITVQLIETKTGFHLWTETYDRKVDDILAIQDEIAHKITRSLKLLLSAQSLKAIKVKNSINPDAYDLYLQAKNFLRQSKTKPNVNSAINHFNMALEIEDNFELAFAGLCDSQIELYKLTLVINDFKQAERSCLSILRSNSYQYEIYVSLGKLYLISGKFHDAETNFQAALTLNLSSVDALIGLARTQHYLNNPALAEQYFVRAIQTAPNNSDAHDHYATYLFYLGQSDKAIREYKKVIALNPNYAEAYNSLGGVYFSNGDIELGIKVFKQSLAIQETQEAYSNLGTAYFMTKDFEQAAKMYQQAIKLSPDDHRYWGFLAESYEHIPTKQELVITTYQQAIKIAEKLLEINNNSNETLASLALYYSKAQQEKQAIKLLKKLENEELLPDLLYTISLSYLSLNNHELALNFLTKAINKGYDKEVIYADENFAALIKNQRFIDITSK